MLTRPDALESALRPLARSRRTTLPGEPGRLPEPSTLVDAPARVGCTSEEAAATTKPRTIIALPSTTPVFSGDSSENVYKWLVCIEADLFTSGQHESEWVCVAYRHLAGLARDWFIFVLQHTFASIGAITWAQFKHALTTRFPGRDLQLVRYDAFLGVRFESMAQYTREFSRFMFCADLPLRLVVCQFVRNLPHEYEALGSELERDAPTSVHDLLDRARHFESVHEPRFATANKHVQYADAPRSAHANRTIPGQMVPGSRTLPRQASPNDAFKCFRCHQPDHKKRDCPQPESKYEKAKKKKKQMEKKARQEAEARGELQERRGEPEVWAL
ncbi:hypothetical protein sr15971 [Sporisorium reilianum SRZ2]|uniref:CCHC-type domain-containing protein n=1 Tax=Sporisorium reilianum (strain SRZ2) TaxID=999809 RepID=E6ZQP6_SPORE|nr:hypothetical protein sr15971 [Sporisorium reilianum SRZ2]